MTAPILRQLHVYAGTAGHSAWFSEDGGETWIHPNSHSGMYLEARVWAFASHVDRPEWLYAGTDMGLFRWDEPSARWTLLPSPMHDVWAIAHDPQHPHRLLAGTRPAALYRSDDAGASWQPIDIPGLRQFSDINMGPTRVTQILFDPFLPDTVWATVEIGGIYRSMDRGLTWTLCEQGLVSSDVHGVLSLRDASGATIVFATTNRGLHRSDDLGAHWQMQPLDSPWQYTRAIVAHPSDPASLFVTNGNGPPGNDGRLLVSRDYGKTFAPVALPEPVNSTVWTLATQRAMPSVMFACTNLGQVFRSDDAGQSWRCLAHTFGELRALHWRPLPAGMRRNDHSLTRATVRAPARI